LKFEPRLHVCFDGFCEKTSKQPEEAMAKKTISEMKDVGNGVDAGREARLAAIQMLIPLGLKAVTEELQGEVLALAGPRYMRAVSSAVGASTRARFSW